MSVLNDPELLQRLVRLVPQQPPFRFIDGLVYASKQSCKGFYTFSADADFYRGHFPGNPITPGVILGECAAQVGALPLGLMNLGMEHWGSQPNVLLTQLNIELVHPVYPEEQVFVASKLVYFRKNNLRCTFEITKSNDEVVSLGEIAAQLTHLWSSKE